MKNSIILFAISLFLSTTLVAQEDFEGTIVYSLQYIDRTGEMSDNKVRIYMGDQQTYHLKKGHYYFEMNGLLKAKSYYSGKDTLFASFSGMNQLFYKLVTEEEEEKILSYEFREGTEKVAGYDCKILVIKTNKGIHTHYSSDEIRVDPKYYAKHNMANWNEYMRIRNGAITLKTISDTKDTYSVMEAKLIERKSLSDSIFQRPNLPVVKMPED